MFWGAWGHWLVEGVSEGEGAKTDVLLNLAPFEAAVFEEKEPERTFLLNLALFEAGTFEMKEPKRTFC